MRRFASKNTDLSLIVNSVVLNMSCCTITSVCVCVVNRARGGGQCSAGRKRVDCLVRRGENVHIREEEEKSGMLEFVCV